MAFPVTRDGMKSAGYEFSDLGRCRGCDASIEWWIAPSGRKMPVNPMPNAESPAISHFASCLKADSFRKGK